MLGKAAGGIMAAVGVAAAVYRQGRPPGAVGEWPFWGLAAAGLAVFLVASRRLARSTDRTAAPPSSRPRRRSQSAAAWIALVVLTAVMAGLSFLLRH